MSELLIEPHYRRCGGPHGTVLPPIAVVIANWGEDR